MINIAFGGDICRSSLLSKYNNEIHVSKGGGRLGCRGQSVVSE